MRILTGGVGGSGMSAIAGFMAGQGHEVWGFDRAFEKDASHPLIARLKAAHINIIGQDGPWPEEIELAVMSTAIEPDRPEVRRIASLGIPIKTRPAFLAELSSAYETIAVAGTSGKSTTSGMLAHLMRALGLRPNFIGGGRVAGFGPIGNYLSDCSRHLVIEACESDGTIVDYHPSASLILNIGLDHHSIEHTTGLFKTLMANTRGKIILNADDPLLASMVPVGAITFSMSGRGRFNATEIELGPLASEFSVDGVRFRLNHPGAHNLMNALSCIAYLAGVRGIGLNLIAEALPGFGGIERRFAIHLNELDMPGGRLVIDDYAHNPDKISALMTTLGRISARVCYVFQPHGYGPTRLMKDGYMAAFNAHLRPEDRLILMPIFYAGGTAAQDISSHDLAAGIKGNVITSSSAEDLINQINPTDLYSVYAVFGARDEGLSALAMRVAERVKLRGAG